MLRRLHAHQAFAFIFFNNCLGSFNFVENVLVFCVDSELFFCCSPHFITFKLRGQAQAIIAGTDSVIAWHSAVAVHCMPISCLLTVRFQYFHFDALIVCAVARKALWSCNERSWTAAVWNCKTACSCSHCHTKCSHCICWVGSSFGPCQLWNNPWVASHISVDLQTDKWLLIHGISLSDL